MSFPLASASKVLSDADKATLQSAANQQFMDQVQAAIANATSLGKQVVYATTFENCDIIALTNFFTTNGYAVYFPDIDPRWGWQPAELFGQFWIAYWAHQSLPPGVHLHNPVRMGIAWQLPTA